MFLRGVGAGAQSQALAQVQSPAAVVLAAVLVSLLGVLATAAAPHSEKSTFGVRKAGDQLLIEYRVTRRAKPLLPTTEFVAFPPARDNSTVGAITAVEVYNTKSLKDVVIQSGGEGHRHVAVTIHSKLGRGLDTVVKIYGFAAAATATMTSAALSTATSGDATTGTAANTEDAVSSTAT